MGQLSHIICFLCVLSVSGRSNPFVSSISSFKTPLKRASISSARRASFASPNLPNAIYRRGGYTSSGSSGGGSIDGSTDLADPSIEETLNEEINEVIGGGSSVEDVDTTSPSEDPTDVTDNEEFFSDNVDMKKMAGKLAPRNSVHFSRKLTHFSTGLIMAALYQMVPKKIFVGVGTFCSVGLCAVEVARYKKGFRWLNRIFYKCFGGVLRKHEMDGKFTGTFYYFAGVTATAYFFPPTAAVLGIAQLAIADPTASYFGRKTKDVYWSRIEGGMGGLGRNKGILGFLGGAAMCIPFNYALLRAARWSGPRPTTPILLLASALVGMAGAFADLAVPTPTLSVPKNAKLLGVKIPPFHIDDNFVVPIFTAFVTLRIFEVMMLPGLKLAPYILWR
ncbi:hypothetical protein TrLO_g8576 [Triparma laevis f. longispina]|uniref:Phosphatidate cytidylyltransferase n=1 Tax=Triparma laevis f. longispina TaxID=1714387 RepID=A0A9W7KVX7_9STRA|nr:hypothetical protein TrLO_g8576 [Triparma laevis f. longispina]